jgi:hypothetical protein
LLPEKVNGYQISLAFLLHWQVDMSLKAILDDNSGDSGPLTFNRLPVR